MANVSRDAQWSVAGRVFDSHELNCTRNPPTFAMIKEPGYGPVEPPIKRRYRLCRQEWRGPGNTKTRTTKEVFLRNE